MKNEDKIKSENLLADKDALEEAIREGENQESKTEEDVQETEKQPETDTEVEHINVYSDNPNMKWFIVYVRTGHEQKAKEQLEQRIKSEGMQQNFGHVLVPTENVVEVAKGKRKTGTRKFFPGYMLVQMVMNENNWHFVKSTPRIVGFVGGSVNPPPINESEVVKITSQVEQRASRPVPRMTFEEGENVRVVEGPFMNFTGIVEEVKPEKAKLKVLVSIFGRSTPVELEFVQVEKI